MRRAVVAIVLTVMGLFFLLDYKSSPVALSHVGVAALPSPGTTDPRTDSGPPPTGAPPTEPPPTTLGPPRSSPPSSSPPTTAAPPTTAKPAPTGTRTITGPAVNTEYGDVQVAVTLSGTRITDVTAVALPTDRARSRAISQYAAPILRTEVLAAQGAQIDAVSGASYTSEGYAQSLQAALDQARGG